MIRKPSADWQREESATVKTVRKAVDVTHRGATVARRSGHILRGLGCFFFAALWGFVALTGGLFGSLPTLIGVGAMAGFMGWAGMRAFAKAREA